MGTRLPMSNGSNVRLLSRSHSGSGANHASPDEQGGPTPPASGKEEGTDLTARLRAFRHRMPGLENMKMKTKTNNELHALTGVASAYLNAREAMLAAIKAVWPSDEFLDSLSEPMEMTSCTMPVTDDPMDGRSTQITVTVQRGGVVRQTESNAFQDDEVYVDHFWTLDKAMDRLGARFLVLNLEVAYDLALDAHPDTGAHAETHDAWEKCKALADALSPKRPRESAA